MGEMANLVRTRSSAPKCILIIKPSLNHWRDLSSREKVLLQQVTRPEGGMKCSQHNSHTWNRQRARRPTARKPLHGAPFATAPTGAAPRGPAECGSRPGSSGLRHTSRVAKPTPEPDGKPERRDTAAPRRHRKAHTTARDLERYAGLFAQRTSVMRSSAMRDLMEITARPDVISLAGGLPDTSTFSPQSFARQMTKIAQESSAEALQYGPTEGFESSKECIRQVMAAE